MEKMNVLIAGAGVAGLTCYNLLRKQGLEPTLIERQPKAQFNKSGYMLGILPLGGRVFNELDAREPYFDHSIPMQRYRIKSFDGQVLNSYPLDFIQKQYGSYRGISRIELIDILMDQVEEENIHFGTTISELQQSGESVEVTFSNGEQTSYPLVIAADGLYSKTRELILQDSEYRFRSTGWGGWVTWLDLSGQNTYEEFWGAGKFIGLYPVKGKTGVFVGGSMKNIENKTAASFARELKEVLPAENEQAQQALENLIQASDPFFWKFEDCRADCWYKGRAVLLGDAATGFLPTAGVGASMAMDSAAALADELSRSDREHIPYALKLFTQRQKDKVEKAQKNSRQLGMAMFIRSSALSFFRNKMMPFYRLQNMASELIQVMEGQ